MHKNFSVSLGYLTLNDPKCPHPGRWLDIQLESCSFLVHLQVSVEFYDLGMHHDSPWVKVQHLQSLQRGCSRQRHICLTYMTEMYKKGMSDI